MKLMSLKTPKLINLPSCDILLYSLNLHLVAPICIMGTVFSCSITHTHTHTPVLVTLSFQLFLLITYPSNNVEVLIFTSYGKQMFLVGYLLIHVLCMETHRKWLLM
jgi:hypothetical protein